MESGSVEFPEELEIFAGGSRGDSGEAAGFCRIRTWHGLCNPGDDPNASGLEEDEMSYGFDPTGTRTRRSAGTADWRRTGERLLAWITSRPTENWVFFGAGVLIASLFL
jgi:hypothetical protein